MSRPTTMKVDGTVYWTINTYTDSGVLVDADNTPVVDIRKNGSPVLDVATSSKRSGATGIYDYSYNPASESEGDTFTIEETATISSQAYRNTWSFKVLDAERGTDGANTVAPVDVSASVANILADTNELQQNQGDWATATGFNTVVPDNAGITANGAAIAALNDLSASEVENAVWDASTSNHLTALSMGYAQRTTWVLTETNYSTLVKVDGMLEPDGSIGSQFTALALENGPTGSGDDAATIYNYFTSGSNEDAFKATGFNTVAPDNASIALILADTNELQGNQGDWATATVTVSSNMRGTDNALLAGAAPANWSTLIVGTGADTGKVTTSNPASGGGSAHTAQDVANLILAVPTTPLGNTATGSLSLVDTTTNLTNGGSGGPTVQQIVDGVWDELSSAHTTGGTFGAYVDSTLSQIRSVVDSNNTEILLGFGNIATNGVTLTSAQQNVLASQASIDALNDFDPASDVVARVTLVDTTTNLTNGGGGGSCPTAQEIVDAWGNQDQSVYVTQGTLGYYLDAQVSSAGSGGTGLYQATVRVQDNTSNALQGARVNVDGTTLTLTTDSSGEVTFNLDSGVYLLEVSPPANYDTPTGQVLTVSTSDPSDTIFTLSQTTPPSGCTPIWLG